MMSKDAMICEKEAFDKLIKYLSITLREIKKYMKLSDAELYERDIGMTIEELKKCKIKVLNYMNCKNINTIVKRYDFFQTYEENVLPYLKECNNIVKQYKKQV